MPDRSNQRLNETIENMIRMWDGTIHGQMIRNMYENGSDYEIICEMAHIDYGEYEEDAEMQEIKLSKLKRLEAEKQEFKQMYAELFPHLSIVADILEKYRDVGTIGKDGNVNIYIGKDGYISMGDFLEGWRLLRASRDADPEIVCEVREKVEG